MASELEVGWLVPFDAEGGPAVYIHAHGKTDDHGGCGPVVLCCERCVAPYAALSPDLVQSVSEYAPQGATDLVGWFETGLLSMYFVLCDDEDANVVYLFGLKAEPARRLLTREVSPDIYRRADLRARAER